MISVSVTVLKLANKLPTFGGGLALSRQLVRSYTSPALFYAEAQACRVKERFSTQNENMPERTS